MRIPEEWMIKSTHILLAHAGAEKVTKPSGNNVGKENMQKTTTNQNSWNFLQ